MPLLAKCAVKLCIHLFSMTTYPVQGYGEPAGFPSKHNTRARGWDTQVQVMSSLGTPIYLNCLRTMGGNSEDYTQSIQAQNT